MLITDQAKWLRGGILLLSGFVICLLYSYHLDFPQELYYDEEHHVPVVFDILEKGRYPFERSSHSPLWHFLTAGSISLFGFQAVSWRIVSLVSGLVCIGLVYAITLRLSRSMGVASLAAFFFAFDGLSFTQARIGMLNALALMFMLLSIWFFLQFYADQRWSFEKASVWAGVMWGLALSTKLTAVSLCFLYLPLVVHIALREKKTRGTLLFKGCLYFGFIPFLVFFSSHLFIPFLNNSTLLDILRMQLFNLVYHLHVAEKQTHLYASEWWSWPLLQRPIWYYYDRGQVIRGILCIGNPAVFFMFPFTLCFIVWDYIRTRSQFCGFVLLAFLTQWLFYALGGRLKFFHYYYFAFPFLAMATSIWVGWLWQRGIKGRIGAVVYILLVIVMFVFWYPLLTGLPISEDSYLKHMWFRSWI